MMKIVIMKLLMMTLMIEYGECLGNSIIDVNGTCCDEAAFDICSVCYGNGET